MHASDVKLVLVESPGITYCYRETPRPVLVAPWSSAASLVLPHSRYAALLVSLHVTALYQEDLSHDDPAVRDYLEREHAFQQQLIDSLRADLYYAPYAAPEMVARNRRLVARFDGISLALCHALDFEHAHTGVPTADAETTITVTPVATDPSEYAVDPWPFREDEVTLVYEGRRLEHRFTDVRA